MKKGIKKRITLLLVMSMVLVTLVACNKTTDEATSNTETPVTETTITNMLIHKGREKIASIPDEDGDYILESQPTPTTFEIQIGEGDEMTTYFTENQEAFYEYEPGDEFDITDNAFTTE